MPTTQTKSRKPSTGKRASQPAATSTEVLTLSEAAAYLRVPEEAVLRAVGPGGVPARLIGGEWRFLKSALQDWLRTPPQRGSREASMKIAGAFKDDPDLEEIVREAWHRRGQAITVEA